MLDIITFHFSLHPIDRKLRNMYGRSRVKKRTLTNGNDRYRVLLDFSWKNIYTYRVDRNVVSHGTSEFWIGIQEKWWKKVNEESSPGKIQRQRDISACNSGVADVKLIKKTKERENNEEVFEFVASRCYRVDGWTIPSRKRREWFSTSLMPQPLLPLPSFPRPSSTSRVSSAKFREQALVARVSRA